MSQVDAVIVVRDLACIRDVCSSYCGVIEKDVCCKTLYLLGPAEAMRGLSAGENDIFGSVEIALLRASM